MGISGYEAQTPLERATMAVRYAPWDPDEESMALQFARAAFGSVWVDGLAEVLIQHRDYRQEERYPDDDWYVCRCGTEIETELKEVDPAFRWHVADEVKRWLMGGPDW